jgi:hypothetical protein
MTTKSPYLRNCAMSALLVGACGTLWGCGARSVMEKPEDDLPTLPGTGGAPTTGGTAGTFQATGGTFWATGGTGGGFIGSCEYPSCLWNLIRDCQVVGPCTGEEAQPAGSSTDIWEDCCSNGVDELTTIQTQGSKVTATAAVTKNGNKCYDVNVTTSADGSTLNYVWLDPSGQAVAKASISLWALGPSVIECGNGESMPMTNTCQPDGSQAAVITTGTCR